MKVVYQKLASDGERKKKTYVLQAADDALNVFLNSFLPARLKIELIYFEIPAFTYIKTATPRANTTIL